MMTRISVSTSYLFVMLLATSLAMVTTENCRGQEATVTEPATTEPAAEEELVVPDGDAAALIKFIEEIANPKSPPESRDEMRAYMRKVSVGISEAASKVLTGQATDQQLIDAVEWKLESFRVRKALGDRTAAQDEDSFYDSLEGDERGAVIKASRRAKLRGKVNVWPRLSNTEQEALVKNFVNSVKTYGATWEDAMEANRLGRIADFGGGELAVSAFDELLPMFREASDPKINQMLPELEATVRFLNLLGSQLELEGSLLDGSELDWESYRGKVVLVDFWATWCGPCRAEVPNVLANYAAYHDKGFEVLGISLDESRDEAQQYIQQTGIPWKTVFSGKRGETSWDAPMARKYAVNAIPRAILVDQEGTVVHLTARGRILSQQLQELLGEPSADAASSDDMLAEKDAITK